MRVFASMPRLESLKGGNKEIYVVSIATDLRGETDRYDRTESVNNQPLDRVVPADADKSLLRYYIVAVSNVFERVRPGRPVAMLGDGIILYPELDPKGLLGLDIFVIESDSGHRSAGRLLDGLFSDEKVRGGIDSLVAAGAAVTAPLVGSVASAIASAIPAILRHNRDDLLFSIAYSGRESRNYGFPGPGTHLRTLGNDLVECDVVFDLIDG